MRAKDKGGKKIGSNKYKQIKISDDKALHLLV
jgi:hypothetical protein